LNFLTIQIEIAEVGLNSAFSYFVSGFEVIRWQLPAEMSCEA